MRTHLQNNKKQPASCPCTTHDAVASAWRGVFRVAHFRTRPSSRGRVRVSVFAGMQKPGCFRTHIPDRPTCPTSSTFASCVQPCGCVVVAALCTGAGLAACSACCSAGLTQRAAIVRGMRPTCWRAGRRSSIRARALLHDSQIHQPTIHLSRIGLIARTSSATACRAHQARRSGRPTRDRLAAEARCCRCFLYQTRGD